MIPTINALAQTVNGLYKAECVKPDGPFHTADELEFATLSSVHWFNHERIRSNIGHQTPIEYESDHQHLQTSAQTTMAPG